MNKAAEDINDIAKKTFGTDKMQAIAMCDECRVTETHQSLAAVKSIEEMIPSNLGSMRHALWRLLQSKDEHLVRRYCEYGRWDQRALTRMLAGSQSLYKQEDDITGMKTAVTIMFDMSGSMSGHKAYYAAACAFALANTMEQLAGHGVVYEIVGFSDSHYRELANEVTTAPKKRKRKKSWWSFSGGDDEGTDFADYGSSYGQYSSWRGWSSGSYFWSGVAGSTNTVGIVQFKGFGEKLTARKPYIASMIHRIGGGTPDSQGLLIALKDVISRPEPNKVVMMITDGMGDTQGIRAGCAFAKQVGVDVIGVGIGGDCRDVTRVYENAIFSHSIEGLGQVAFTALVQQIEKNRRLHYGEVKARRRA